MSFAVDLARQTGQILLDFFWRENLQTSYKADHSIVTEADTSADRFIARALAAEYPNDLLLSEELQPSYPGGQADSDVLNRATWVIDPIDGTTNFSMGMHFWGVLLARLVKGVPELAVMYFPLIEELYSAQKGGGAFLNDRRIRVSKRTRLEESLVGTGFPFRKIDNLDQYLAMLRAVTEKAAGVRRPGAAALDLAYVACGRFDAFFELGLSPWDVAAGSLLITEAGGLIGNFTADGDYLFAEEVVAGSPKVFAAMIALLRGTRGAAQQA